MHLSRFSGLLITFLVAACSIIYELVFSQTLTIGFGSTVERYSITIGLFLFSLGIGALVYNSITIKSKHHIFVLVELGISLSGILGFIFVLFISQAHSLFFVNSHGQLIALIASHAPIILIGIFSGIEIPLLTDLIGKDTFSTVLGVDYFGSLIGSLIYGLIFYPYFGLYKTVIITALLNLFVLFYFLWRFQNEFQKKIKTVYNVCSIIVLGTLLTFLFLEKDLYKMYSEGILRKGYFLYHNAPTHKLYLKDNIRTKYANVLKYEFYYNGKNIQCVNLDYHVQACDSWAHAYHDGLVDVPLAFFSPQEKLSVLIVGGGDFIAANNILQYGNRIQKIHMVDIDKEFQEYAKNDRFFQEYHKNSFLDKKLRLFQTDGYNFMRHTKNKYDLIIMDLPGLYTDKINHLYSHEFFLSVQGTLKKGGLLITWFYPTRKAYKQTNILFSTLAKANFMYYTKHFSYREYRGRGNVSIGQVEKYFIFSNSAQKNYSPSPRFSDRINQIYMTTLFWTKVPQISKHHSLIYPNYDFIIRPKYKGTQSYLKNKAMIY